MFRPRYRQAPFTDPLNWTDYRWETGYAWPGAAASRAWRHGRGRRGGHPLLLLFIAGLAAVVGARLLSSLQAREGSWARRGMYAALLLLIVSTFSRNRRNGWW